LYELHVYDLNRGHIFSVICSTTTRKNEKFAKVGNSSKLGCLGSNANGECPCLHQGASASTRVLGSQELEERGHERDSPGVEAVQTSWEFATVRLREKLSSRNGR